MSLRHALASVGTVTLFVLIWPAAVPADHVTVEASAVAVLKERAGSGAWSVEVRYDVRCIGATRGVLYFGNLSLVDERTGERIYLGGVSSASGTVTQVVAAKPYWRRMRPELKAACGEDLGGHGSDFIEVNGGAAIVPARDADSEGGGGSGGGDSGSGSGGGGDPTAPLGAGGCLRALVGTDGPDTLTGSGAGDVVFGRGGRDSIDGRNGHDCLIGGAGNDALRGGQGNDRLTGGSGADTLLGGAGINTYDAGSGNDVVDSVNRRNESVRCGAGQDRARVDLRDRVSGCEHVTRASR
jgi:Ca2+-binding RTX toxin-like protein